MGHSGYAILPQIRLSTISLPCRVHRGDAAVFGGIHPRFLPTYADYSLYVGAAIHARPQHMPPVRVPHVIVSMFETHSTFSDIAPKNLMRDETRVVSAGSHFIRSRTHTGSTHLFRSNNRCAVGPFDYYYIDFGLSLYFPDGPATALTSGGLRNFGMIPKLSGTEPFNPFKVDVSRLGLSMQTLINVCPRVRLHLMYSIYFPFQTYAPLKIFAPVMMNHNPQDRPARAESLAQLNSIAALMSSRRRSAPMWKKKHFFQLRHAAASRWLLSYHAISFGSSIVK